MSEHSAAVGCDETRTVRMTSISTTFDSPGVRATGTSAVRVRAATICLAAAFVAVWAFCLSRNIFDPIGCDQAMYQYMAERVMAGDRLYVDVWDQNAPGIVGIHWLATRLVGRTPMALRVFDAAWQCLTMIVLAGLVVRDGRRWSAAWLAAGLYALAYYSMGYVHTAQREGFAVLPLLLSVHLVVGGSAAGRGTGPSWLRCFVAGALGLVVFSIKPPLGLCFGGLWLYELARGWQRRREGLAPMACVAGLTAGFLAAAAGAVALLMHLGSWDACWRVLTRRDMPGYVMGPTLIRGILPSLAAGAVLLAVAAFGATARGCPDVARARETIRVSIAAFVAFGVMFSARRWPEWGHVLSCFAGLWIPAAGSVLLCAWRGRSETWRLCLLMLLTTTASVIVQGQFFLYHVPPMLAFTAYLSAVELDHRLRRWPAMDQRGTALPLCGTGFQPVGSHGSTVWSSVCIGSIAFLVFGQWWPTMTFVTARPYVLAGTTLADHYTSITKHKLSCPTYATTIKVAERLRELTAENEPIATLCHEARIYYFARRPPVCRLVSMHVAYQHMFADYMQAIRDRRPKVIVARIPEPLRGSRDLAAIETAVFREAESFFGPPAAVLRDLYRVSETIDDVCILQLGQNIMPCQNSI
ncbi:MAG: hypothetical protein HY718_14185 [Planctomycetes bacterium]|nr:hypothetical protein [Planctomycetota bacterium]